VRVEATGAALVSGDPDALGRVVRILLDNAFRHGAPPVDVAVASRDGRVSLEVRDAGPGIPAGSEERVFERFYRADPARTTRGTGLGLAIVKHIAQLHGASVDVEGEVGQGSTFRVSFPATA
jgi:signal transduction histidine kinase